MRRRIRKGLAMLLTATMAKLKSIASPFLSLLRFFIDSLPPFLSTRYLQPAYPHFRAFRVFCKAFDCLSCLQFADIIPLFNPQS